MTVRRLLRIVEWVVVASIIGWGIGIVPIARVVIAQGWNFRVASDCAAQTGAVTGAVCIQIGVPPTTWFYTGTAWAQFADTTGTPVTLDSVSEIASVAMAGQRAAVFNTPANQTIAGATTLVPVRSADGTVYVEDNVYFHQGGLLTQTQAFPLGDPTQPLSLGVWSPLASVRLGVKMTVYGGTGSVVATMRATAAPGLLASVGNLGLLQETDLGGGSRGLNVVINHALAQYGYTRSNSLTFDANADEVAISGGGGQVCAEVQSGATMTVAFEAHVGDGAYTASDFLPDGTTTPLTSTSTFPVRGCFTTSAWTDYKIRATAFTSGTAKVWIFVSAGAGMPRLNVGLNAGTNLIGFVAPGASATTTNSWLRCLNLPAGTPPGLTTASTNATNCKASGGNLHGVFVINPTATIPFLRLYDSASGPTCSSATGFITSIPLPASTSGSGFSLAHGPVGFTNGLGWCVTGASSSTDTSNAPAGIFIQALYK